MYPALLWTKSREPINIKKKYLIRGYYNKPTENIIELQQQLHRQYEDEQKQQHQGQQPSWHVINNNKRRRSSERLLQNKQTKITNYWFNATPATINQFEILGKEEFAKGEKIENPQKN